MEIPNIPEWISIFMLATSLIFYPVYKVKNRKPIYRICSRDGQWERWKIQYKVKIPFTRWEFWVDYKSVEYGGAEIMEFNSLASAEIRFKELTAIWRCSKKLVELNEVEKQIAWLYDNLIGDGSVHVTEGVLKRSLSYMLFISTCKYAPSLTFEQYRMISAAIKAYKRYYLKPMNLLMTSLFSFAEFFCVRGMKLRTYEESNRRVPREELDEIMDSPLDWGSTKERVEIRKAADEIFETEKDVHVLKKLLRERDAVWCLRHSRLRLLLQDKGN